jgi:hypothetical protein
MISLNVKAKVIPLGMLQSGNANEIDDSTDNIEPECEESISSIAAGTEPNSVAVWGNYAYVTDQNTDKMYVYNVTNKTSPTLVNTVATGEIPWNIVVSNGYAYVISSADLQVFDLSNPELPVLNQTVFAYGDNLVISGNYLYLFTGFGGTEITLFDISTPTSVKTIGTIFMDDNSDYEISKNIKNLIVSGNYAYVTMSYLDYSTYTTTFKLWSVNITNPTNPVVFGSTDLPSDDSSSYTSFDSGIFGNYLYAVGDNIFYVIDISNPAAPQFLKTLPNSYYFYKIRISGNYALFLASNSKLLIYDLNTDPSTPNLVKSIQSQSSGKSIVVSENYAYVINYFNKLEIFKLNCSN